MSHVCLGCQFSRAIGREFAYCKKTGKIVELSRGSCEKFKDGLARFRRSFLPLTVLSLLPFLRMTTIPEGLNNIGAWIDKVTTMCLVIVILLLLVFVLWLLSKLFGGGTRG